MIFLDIGSHDGQTLEEVVVGYGFDEIHAFEPMPAQFAHLAARFIGQATLHNFGLSDRSGSIDLFGDNANMGTSIYADKSDVNPAVVTRCRMVRASEFFAPFAERSLIVKLNCEGAEIPILYDLCGSGEIHKAAEIMIDFDCRKVPSMVAHERQVKRRMAEVGFDRWVTCEEVMHGVNHQDRIRSWLEKSGFR